MTIAKILWSFPSSGAKLFQTTGLLVLLAWPPKSGKPNGSENAKKQVNWSMDVYGEVLTEQSKKGSMQSCLELERELKKDFTFLDTP